jgi:hypothetical protein
MGPIEQLHEISQSCILKRLGGIREGEENLCRYTERKLVDTADEADWVIQEQT